MEPLTIVLLLVIVLVALIVIRIIRCYVQAPPADIENEPICEPVRNLRLLRRRRNMVEQADDDEDEAQDDCLLATTYEPTVSSGQKIGKKKMKRIREKEERRQMRMEMEEQRAAKKEREEAVRQARELEDQRKQEEETKQKLEELRLREEERNRQEELYKLLKQNIEVSSEGFEESKQVELKALIDFLRNSRICPLEDVAAEFEMKISDVIDRIETLIKTDDIMGFIDDRGWFVWLDNKIIGRIVEKANDLGRFSVSEFTQHCNDILLD